MSHEPHTADDAPELPSAPVPVTPTPVRSSLGEPSAPSAGGRPGEPAAPTLEETELSVGGRTWIVRCRGLAHAGPAATPVPLLLLGFFDGADAPTPVLERLVPASSLADLTEAHLMAALESSSAPPSGEPGRPFFPEIEGRGRKDS
jgi:hypothetical protein